MYVQMYEPRCIHFEQYFLFFLKYIKGGCFNNILKCMLHSLKKHYLLLFACHYTVIFFITKLKSAFKHEQFVESLLVPALC